VQLKYLVAILIFNVILVVMKKNAESDIQIGKNLIEVKTGMKSVRDLRAGLMEMAFLLLEAPRDVERSLLLEEPRITEKKLAQEWESVSQTLQPKILGRMNLIILKKGEFISFPKKFDPGFFEELKRKINLESGFVDVPRQAYRGSTYFLIMKILIHQWLRNKGPMTVTWLAKQAECSYPTVANILRNLGSQISRLSYRSFELNRFPEEAFKRMLMNAGEYRATVRFADYSGQPFSPEAYIRRLEKSNPPDLSIGGVESAKHYYPGLDLVGSPRLDLSKHVQIGKRKDWDFIEKLDPALNRVDDPFKPANVVVHFVQHKESFFEAREEGLSWADPVECLLDLHELHLEAQATDFLNVLLSRRQSKS